MLVLYLVIFFNISYHTIHVNISQYTNILLGISVGSWEWVWMVGDEHSEVGMREKGSKWAKMALLVKIAQWSSKTHDGYE